MTPAFSSAERRREHCDAERPTRSPRSLLVNRPSSPSAWSSFTSKSSMQESHVEQPISAYIVHLMRFQYAVFTQFALRMRYRVRSNRSGGNTMGPFPHDAPPAAISAENPVGTDGFEFVEFAHPQPEALATLFWRMGYQPVARHRTKNITLYRQGDISYL